MAIIDIVECYNRYLSAGEFERAISLRQKIQIDISQRAHQMHPIEYLQIPWAELTNIGIVHPPFSAEFRRQVFAQFARDCKLALTDFLLKCLRAPPLVQQCFMEGDWAAFWYLPRPTSPVTSETNLTKPIEKAWLNLKLLERIISACNWRYNPDQNEEFVITATNYQGTSPIILERL